MIHQKTLLCSLVVGLISLAAQILPSQARAQPSDNVQWHATNKEPLSFEVKGAIGYYVKTSGAYVLKAKRNRCQQFTTAMTRQAWEFALG
jgi:hypothetical protein